MNKIEILFNLRECIQYFSSDEIKLILNNAIKIRKTEGRFDITLIEGIDICVYVNRDIYPSIAWYRYGLFYPQNERDKLLKCLK